MNNVSIRDVARNPEWLPHTYGTDGQALTFVHVPRAARLELRFLFDEHFGDKFRKASSPAAAVAAEMDPANRAPLHFIFHTSLCGSSLLARALEIPGVATSLREPAILGTLAHRVIRSDEPTNADQLELVLRLLERPFCPGEVVVTKPSNFANPLLDQILRTRNPSRAVLLYSDLETYLISLLKLGIWGRILGRKLFTHLMKWSTLKLDLSADEILELSDVQVAAMAWLMQIHHFDAMAKAFGPRVMLLNSSQLFADPVAKLHEVTTFFELGMTEKDAEDIVAGPIFAKHSKDINRDYSVEERQRDLATVGKANSEEISMVVKWIESFASHHGAPLSPSA